MLQQGQFLPVRRRRGDQDFLFQATAPEDIESLQITLSEQATTAYAIFVQLQGLLVKKIIPEHCTMGKVRALYIQRYSAFTTGLTVRPKMAMQKELFWTINSFLTQKGNDLNKLPDLCLDSSVEAWPEDLEMRSNCWGEIRRRVRLAMRRVRLRRQFH